MNYFNTYITILENNYKYMLFKIKNNFNAYQAQSEIEIKDEKFYFFSFS